MHVMAWMFFVPLIMYLLACSTSKFDAHCIIGYLGFLMAIYYIEFGFYFIYLIFSALIKYVGS